MYYIDLAFRNFCVILSYFLCITFNYIILLYLNCSLLIICISFDCFSVLFVYSFLIYFTKLFCYLSGIVIFLCLYFNCKCISFNCICCCQISFLTSAAIVIMQIM